MTYAWADEESWRVFSPQGYNLGLWAKIRTSKQEYGLQSWDKGFKASVWASRLIFGPQG